MPVDIHIHVFSLESFNSDSIAYARDFGPTAGMWEDPASGTVSAALGFYLHRHGIANRDM